MKKIIVIALIIVSIFIIAFYVSWVFGGDLPTLPPTDRSCTTNADCISTCSCGCINKNENCKSDEFTDCARHAYESFNCQCVNNVCQNVDGRNASNEPADDIDVSNLQNEEIIDVRCWRCVDCGCDVHILRTDEKIGHASYKKTYECLDSLTKVDGEYYNYYITKDQFIKLQNCLNN